MSELFVSDEEKGPYHNYSGPVLTKATLGDKDILEQIQEMYGPTWNWRNRFWRYADFMTDKDVGKVMYFEFSQKNGRVDWMKHTIPADLSVVMNGPLFTPFSEV